MNMLARYSLLLFTLFVSGFSLGFAPAIAEELPEDTNKIESLTPEQAQKLAREFPGMKVDIEVKGAGVLSKFGLPLSGLKSLDAETAKELAGYGKAMLVLNGLTKLDAAAAKSLAGFKGATLLDGLTTLDADTAKALAEFKGNNLYLSGLTTLDADTAKALAEFKGRSLSLCGLTTLDANTAEALAEFKGEAMFLTGLTTLDADTAKSLAGFKGATLLDGLTMLDAVTAKALAEFKGEVALPDKVLQAFFAKNPLTPETALAWAVVSSGNLSHATTLDHETAKALAKYKGKRLSLSGLTTLDAATAKALAEFKAWVDLPDKVLQAFFAENPLTPETALAWAVVSSGNLSHATTLDHETAKALAKYKGKRLYLAGLTALDTKTAKALAEFKGSELALTGLTTLDAATAEALAGSKAWNGVLPKLTTLDAATAKSLAEFKGDDLYFNGLTTLDADTAKALAEFKGGALVLRGLTTLDAATAKLLAEFKGARLILEGLTALDANTAEALAEFKGEVALPGKVLKAFFAKNPLTSETALFWAVVSRGNLSHVTSLDTPDSVAVARALASRKGRLALPNLKKISPKTLSALIEKEDVEIPLIETLELIPEPDGSPNDDFVIPKWLEKRQNQKR